MKSFLFVLSLIVAFSINSYSQTSTIECPPDKVCLSQAAAQKAAENAKVIPQLEEKIKIQEEGLKTISGLLDESKQISQKNEIDLKDRLQKTEIELAIKTGQLIGKEAEVTRLTAIIDFMLKNGRIKKVGLINLF